MAALVPRGVSDDKRGSGELLSPSDDLNVTVTKLLNTNARLLDKIGELEGDKEHFQNKLEEYIRYEREEGDIHDSTTVVQLERRISELLAEKADLHARLLKKDRDIGDLCTSSSHDPQHSERDHRAHLLQCLNDQQASQQKYAKELDMLKLENQRLREEVRRLRKMVDWKEGGQVERRPSWELYPPSGGSDGYSSLPESLSSHSTLATGQSGYTKGVDIPNLAALRLTSNPSPLPDTAATTAAELKKIKKQLERYKTTNIELDQKLKDAKLELRKYAENHSDVDVRYRMDLERFRSENNQLRMQLDRALSENNRLKSLLSRR
jgi:chromosome segregation ATPase